MNGSEMCNDSVDGVIEHLQGALPVSINRAALSRDRKHIAVHWAQDNTSGPETTGREVRWRNSGNRRCESSNLETKLTRLQETNDRVGEHRFGKRMKGLHLGWEREDSRRRERSRKERKTKEDRWA
jgi:hypothetical protein